MKKYSCKITKYGEGIISKLDTDNLEEVKTFITNFKNNMEYHSKIKVVNKVTKELLFETDAKGMLIIDNCK